MSDEQKYIRCKRCNRFLRSDKARARGYGDHCWKEYKKENRELVSLFSAQNVGGLKNAN